MKQLTKQEEHLSNVKDFFDMGLTIIRGKSDDYSKINNPFSNFVGAGIVAGITPERVILALIGVKLSRIENLLKVDTPNNESMEDSIVDACNYLAILGSLLRSKRKANGNQ